MTSVVRISETDASLEDIVDRVIAGQDVVISRQGHAVAMVSAIAATQPTTSPTTMIENARALRTTILASGQPPFSLDEILSLRDEGRR